MSLLALGAFGAGTTLLSSVGCSSSEDDTSNGGDAGADRRVLEPPPNPCDLSKDFGTPKTIAGLPTGSAKASAGRLTPDELTIYYDDGTGLVAATRPDRSSPFETKRWFDTVNSTPGNFSPWVTADNKAVFFVSARNGNVANLFRAERSDSQSAFGSVKKVLELAPDQVTEPYFRENFELWFGLRTGNDFRIARSAIAADGSFGPAQPQTELREGTSTDGAPVISLDGLRIFFGSTRPTNGDYDIWTATRSNDSAAFSKPTRVPVVNTSSSDSPTWLSPDSCRLYFVSNRPEENQTDSGSEKPFHMFVAERPQ